MDQQKSIHLYFQGVEAWNGWARRLLRKKQRLIKANEWHVNHEFDFEAGHYRTVGLNEASANWLDRAFVDLSKFLFIAGDETSNKTKARNREEKRFINSREIPVEGQNIDFRGFIFPGDARFDHSEFHGVALFNGAEFHGTAWFSNAAFFTDTWFEQVQFHNLACFHQVEFAKFTTFACARFEDNANFEAIRAGRSFDLEGSEFCHEVPDFIDAEFELPPRLGGVDILPRPRPKRFSPRIRAALKGHDDAPRYMRRLILRDIVLTEWATALRTHMIDGFANKRRKRADEAHFRALRQIARSAGDRLNERKFYAGQMRSRRHLADRLSHFPGGFFRYLFGAAQEVTSNFGRSMWRPAICSLMVFYAFTGLYLVNSSASIMTPCANTAAITPVEAATTIAKRNAFLIFGDNAEVDVYRAKTCLRLTQPIEQRYVRKIPLPDAPLIERKDQSRLASLDESQQPAADSDDATVKLAASQEPLLGKGMTDVVDLELEEALTTGSIGTSGTFANLGRLAMVQMALHLLLALIFIAVLRNHIRLR